MRQELPQPPRFDADFALELADRAVMDLRNWLADQRHQRLLLLCDPAATDPARALISDSGLRVIPLGIGHPDVATTDRPYLVEIPSEPEHERLVAQTVSLAISEAVAPAEAGLRSRNVCAWLHTTRPVDEAARALGTLGTVMIDGRLRLFRFWDPRILATRNRNDPEDARPVNRDAHTWHFINWVGALNRWSADDLAPFEVCDAVELAAQNELNAVLQRVLHQGRVDREVPWVKAESALQRAQSLGLSRFDDRVRLASDMVRHGAEITQALAIQQILSALSAGRGSYAGATADFDEDDWQRLASEGAQSSKSSAQGETK